MSRTKAKAKQGQGQQGLAASEKAFFCKRLCREGAERFKKEPFNEALVRFVLGCLRELLLASAAHSGAKGFGLGRLNSQAAEAAASAALVQEAMSELLAAAVSVLEVGKGGERFALEIGVAVDEARREYRSAAQVRRMPKGDGAVSPLQSKGEKPSCAEVCPPVRGRSVYD